MSSRPFRFGVVGGARGDGDAEAWQQLAREVEDLGFSTLLLPDNVSAGLAAPLPALTAAATATRSLRVGTFVLNCAVRTPKQVAWEAASVDFLTGGRFELGLGAGRPGAESDGELLGVPFGSPGERVQRLRDTIAAYDTLLESGSAGGHGPAMFGRTVQARPPLLLAAGGAKMLQLAGATADIVTFGLPPQTTDDGLAEHTHQFREVAGERFDDIELGINIAALGADLPPWLGRMVGADPAELIAMGSITLLTGSTDEMADTLLRRRDKTGVSYITVNADYRERFAPVVERLAGR